MSNYRLEIDQTGSHAFVTLLARKVGIFRLRVSFAMMTKFLRAVEYTVNIMRWRQANFVGGSATSINNIKAVAVRPNVRSSEVTYENGDIVVLWQFDDAPPLAINLTPEDAEAMVIKYYKARRMAVN